MPAWRKLHRNWLRRADQSHVVSHPAAVEYDFRRDIVVVQQFRISNFNKGTVPHAGNDQSTDDSAANLDLDHASSTSVSIPVSIDLNGSLQLFQQLSDDFNTLVTMVGNLTELLDEYANQTDTTPSAAQQKRGLFGGIDWASDIGALFPRVVEFATTPVGKFNRGRWRSPKMGIEPYRHIPGAEIAAAQELIPLLERGGQVPESFVDGVSAMSMACPGLPTAHKQSTALLTSLQATSSKTSKPPSSISISRTLHRRTSEPL
jgi:hypothetical protein